MLKKLFKSLPLAILKYHITFIFCVCVCVWLRHAGS